MDGVPGHARATRVESVKWDELVWLQTNLDWPMEPCHNGMVEAFARHSRTHTCARETDLTGEGLVTGFPLSCTPLLRSYYAALRGPRHDLVVPSSNLSSTGTSFFPRPVQWPSLWDTPPQCMSESGSKKRDFPNAHYTTIHSTAAARPVHLPPGYMHLRPTPTTRPAPRARPVRYCLSCRSATKNVRKLQVAHYTHTNAHTLHPACVCDSDTAARLLRSRHSGPLRVTPEAGNKPRALS